VQERLSTDLTATKTTLGAREERDARCSMSGSTHDHRTERAVCLPALDAACAHQDAAIVWVAPLGDCAHTACEPLDDCGGGPGYCGLPALDGSCIRECALSRYGGDAAAQPGVAFIADHAGRACLAADDRPGGEKDVIPAGMPGLSAGGSGPPLPPQHLTTPATSAQLKSLSTTPADWYAPTVAAIAVTSLGRPRTLTGLLRLVAVPSPSSPEWFRAPTLDRARGHQRAGVEVAGRDRPDRASEPENRNRPVAIDRRAVPELAGSVPSPADNAACNRERARVASATGDRLHPHVQPLHKHCDSPHVDVRPGAKLAVSVCTPAVHAAGGRDGAMVGTAGDRDELDRRRATDALGTARKDQRGQKHCPGTAENGDGREGDQPDSKSRRPL